MSIGCKVVVRLAGKGDSQYFEATCMCQGKMGTLGRVWDPGTIKQCVVEQLKCNFNLAVPCRAEFNPEQKEWYLEE